MTTVFRLLLAVGFLVHAGAALAQIAIVPASPKALETVRVIIPSNFLQPPAFGYFEPWATEARISMAANRITLELPIYRTGIMAPGPLTDIALGQLPEGNYQLEIVARFFEGHSPPPIAETRTQFSFAVARKETGKPPWNSTGLWWNPAESGWGLNITQNDEGQIFATWFVYGADGKPMWYHVPDGRRTSERDFTGPVYRSTGPDIRGVFDASKVDRVPAGTATFSFFDYARGFAIFDLDGQRILKEIRRLEF
jgi:hypothetical protein